MTAYESASEICLQLLLQQDAYTSRIYIPQLFPRPQFTTHVRTHKTRLFRNRLYIYVFRAIGGQDLRGNVIRFYPRRICLPQWSSLGVGMTWDVYHRYLVARVIFTCHGQRWVIFAWGHRRRMSLISDSYLGAIFSAGCLVASLPATWRTIRAGAALGGKIPGIRLRMVGMSAPGYV